MREASASIGRISQRPWEKIPPGRRVATGVRALGPWHARCSLAVGQRMSRLAIAQCLWFASCAYRAGSFSSRDHAFLGARATFGCIDASVSRRPVEGQQVIDYDFGNGCDHPVVVDLARVETYGRDVDGHRVTLQPYDPGYELGAALLDGRSVGDEAISYIADATTSLASVCVDPSAAFGGDGPRWTCFASAP
jgi:hypothetical protein